MKLIFAILFLASFAAPAYAWTYAPPSCIQQYSSSGADFTYLPANSALCAATSYWQFAMIGNSTTQLPFSFYSSQTKANWKNLSITNNASGEYLNLPSNLNGTEQISADIFCSVNSGTAGGGSITGNQTFFLSDGASNITLSIKCTASIGGTICGDTPVTSNASANVSISCNGIKCNISSGNSSMLTTATKINITRNITTSTTGTICNQVVSGTSSANWTANFPINATSYEVNSTLTVAPPDYTSALVGGVNVIHSDFKTNTLVTSANGSAYCKAALYYTLSTFQTDIQVLPMITYVPGVSAFADFYNGDSGVAYIQNNTGQFILDRTSHTWFLVPAFSCIDNTTVYSVQALPQGVFYTLMIQDCYGRASQGVNVTVTLNNATVASATSSIDGSAVVLLQPFTTYRISLAAPNGVSANSTFTPSTSATINLGMQCPGGNVGPSQGYNQIFGDLSYGCSPASGWVSNTTTNITCSASSINSRMVSENMLVYATPYYTTTPLLIVNESSNNSTSFSYTIPVSSSAGSVHYEAQLAVTTVNYNINNSLGTYNLSNYSNFWTTVYADPDGNQLASYSASIQNVIATLNTDKFISPFLWALIAVGVALLAGGYLSQFTLNGAGLVAAGIIIMFALIYDAVLTPSGSVVQLSLMTIGEAALALSCAALLWRLG